MQFEQADFISIVYLEDNIVASIHSDGLVRIIDFLTGELKSKIHCGNNPLTALCKISDN